jgi:hypothetical protein
LTKNTFCGKVIKISIKIIMAEKMKIQADKKEPGFEKIRRFGRMIGGAAIAMELVKLLSADPAAADEKGLEKIAALRNSATEVKPTEAKKDLVSMMKELNIHFDEKSIDVAISKIQHSPAQTASEKRAIEPTRGLESN